MPVPSSSSTTAAIPDAAKRRSCVRSFIVTLLRLLTGATLGSRSHDVVGPPGDLGVGRPADLSARRNRPSG
jgi:hypothetical protein